MKVLSRLTLLALTITLVAGCSKKDEVPADYNGLVGHITLSGAYSLYPMVVKWGEEFSKLHPHVKFDIQGGGAGKGMTDAISGTVDLGMVSRDVNPEEVQKGAYGIGVAKDAVIATFNVKNPYFDEIYKKGITRQQLIDIWITGKITTWGQLLGNDSKEKIEVYRRSDASGAGETFAKYLGGSKEEELVIGIGVFGDPGLAMAITKNVNSVGFNNVNFTFDPGTRKPNPGIAALPLDLDANGALEPEENVYASLDALNEAINKDIYPSPPARQLYLVSKGQPTDSLVVAFLQWVLADGQKFCPEAGYIPLSPEVAKSQQGRLPAPAKPE